jgi:WD40 repeat protein
VLKAGWQQAALAALGAGLLGLAGLVGRLVVSAHYDGVIGVWDLASGKQLQRLPGHSGVVRGVAVSPDGRQVVSGGGDRTVLVWTLPDGHEFVRWVGDSPVTSCRVEPHAPLTITVGDEGGAVYTLELRGQSS